MRIQLAWPGLGWLEPSSYYQFVTMHGMIMVVYLLTALFLGGFGNLLIPLMCGARDMAFPYVNMLSYWAFVVAVLVLLASFFVPGGPTGAGWTLYPPQAITAGTPGSDMGIILIPLLMRYLAVPPVDMISYPIFDNSDAIESMPVLSETLIRAIFFI